jgi:hypothetical protein
MQAHCRLVFAAVFGFVFSGCSYAQAPFDSGSLSIASSQHQAAYIQFVSMT